MFTVKKMLKLVGFIPITAMFVLMIAACEDLTGSSGQGPQDVLVTGMSLSQTSPLSLDRGAHIVVYATVSPETAVFQWVEWVSSDPDVVSVARMPRAGVLTGPESAARLDALSAGTSTITATAMGGGAEEPTATITVTVTARYLPSLHVGMAANAIHRNNWASGIMISLTGTDGFDFENVSAQVRGRGNTTWWAMGEKRPFRIRFDQARPMFGSDYSARDWTIIANAADYSMLRQYSAYFLGRMLYYQSFAPAGHFVHVYLDGEYRGVYMISDQMQVNPGRAELTANNNPALSEFFLEWCGRSTDEEFHFLVCREETASASDVSLRVDRLVFVVEFPGGGILRQNLGHMEFVADFMTRVDRAIYGGDYGEVSQLIDVASFVDFYLVQELFRNHDSFWSSLFFQLKRTTDGSRLFAGPVWDFDLSAGNNFDGRSDYGPQGTWTARWNPWFRHLMDTEWFSQRVAERWGRIRDNEVAAMVDRIWELVGIYRFCFERNFERWPDKLGQNVWREDMSFQTPPTVMAIPDFIGNVEYLADWLGQRITWMDGFLAPVSPAEAMRSRLITPMDIPPIPAGGFW